MKRHNEQTVSETKSRKPVAPAPEKPNAHKYEGLWGWLSYVGWMCLMSPMIFLIVCDVVEAYERLWGGKHYIFYWPIIPLYPVLIGLALSCIILKKSHYSMCLCTKIGFFSVLALLGIVGSGSAWNTGEFDILSGLAMLLSLSCVFFMMWYIRFFYHKIKDGYRFVWLKVLVAILIACIPCLFYTETQNYAIYEDTICNHLHEHSD